METLGDFRLFVRELKKGKLRIVQRKGVLTHMKKWSRRKRWPSKDKDSRAAVENLVVTATLPYAAFTRLTEIVAVVINYNPETIHNDRDFRLLYNLAIKPYQEGQQALEKSSSPPHLVPERTRHLQRCFDGALGIN